MTSTQPYLHVGKSSINFFKLNYSFCISCIYPHVRFRYVSSTRTPSFLVDMLAIMFFFFVIFVVLLTLIRYQPQNQVLRCLWWWKMSNSITILWLLFQHYKCYNYVLFDVLSLCIYDMPIELELPLKENIGMLI